MTAIVVHADWSATAAKRWAASARLVGGRWVADTPRPVGDGVPVATSVLLGVDAVIGLPRAYAALVGIDRFVDVLPELGAGDRSAFFEVAATPAQITPRRPFYPARPGGTSRGHLTQALGLRAEELLRRCERATSRRPAASPLFWTLGANQVGKASIAFWREVLQPLVRGDRPVHLWPFDGPLESLLARPGVTVAEAYPSEARSFLGLPPRRGSKRERAVRACDGGALLAWAERGGVGVTEELRAALADGFGADARGEDRYDAVLGLFGMLEVVTGRRPAGAPRDDPAVTDVEGWILGLDPADLRPP